MATEVYKQFITEMETNPPPSFSIMPLSFVQINQLAMIANRLAEARAAELAAQLATAQARIAELTAKVMELSMPFDHAERAEYYDRIKQQSEWDCETPYGQMLDGLGDEVEP